MNNNNSKKHLEDILNIVLSPQVVISKNGVATIPAICILLLLFWLPTVTLLLFFILLFFHYNVKIQNLLYAEFINKGISKLQYWIDSIIVYFKKNN